MKKSVVLIGPRCCGKTSTGKELAKLLNVPFVDADEMFVNVFGSIDDFVGRCGWGRFREHETEIIERICEEYQGKQIVLTPGGGAVAHNQGDEYRDRNREMLSRAGIVIYLLPTNNLEESARILTERMLADQQTAGQRPSLTDEKDSLQEMLKVVKERNYYYTKAANELIYTREKTVQDVAKEIAVLAR